MFVLVAVLGEAPGWPLDPGLVQASFIDASGRGKWRVQVLQTLFLGGIRTLRNPVSHTLGSINSSDQHRPLLPRLCPPVISRTSS